MQAFSKFKQLSRDIRLIIITALIVSCVGVYAAGECIISATADDVSYNNTTVQAAIDNLYSMAQDHCPEGYECTGSLYEIIANRSVLDDRPSAFVTSSTGVNFAQISSDTNGKGVYEIASTKNDTYPIYYYRGAVTNNNVKFAGFCWKAIRTTDTGGVKLIYNGEPDQDGYCTNTTGTSTQIGTSHFNSNHYSPAYVGYMYGTVYNRSEKSSSALNDSYIYGNSVTYSNGTYTLQDTMTSTGTWSTDYNTLNNNHYTCFSTGTTCSSVYYIYFTLKTTAYYITLKNGKTIEDSLNEMFINNTNSTIKTQIDAWYNTNISSFTNYIEDTVYCNDRSISELNGWDPNGGRVNNSSSSSLMFGSHNRVYNKIPSLECSRNLDRFTVSSSKGNGALTYPVGLITSDEAMYAGGVGITINNTYYLYTNQDYWILASDHFSGNSSHGAYNNMIDSDGKITDNDYILGVRPVISLKSTDVVESGDGTSTNPYVIQTS